MTKKLWLCAWAVAVLMLAGFRPAMATQADDATFKISVGTPPANPNPVDVNENTTVTFNVELYKTNAQGQEDPNVSASSQSYTINAGGGTIVSVSGGFTIAANGQSATMSKNGNNSSPSFTASVTVKYATIGTKTVSMSGGVSYTDGSSDSDSASVSIQVIKSVPIVTIESDKSSICAGGVGSEVHRATMTATVSYLRGKSAEGKSVKFSVQNSDAEYPAAIEGADSDGTKTVTTNSSGITQPITLLSGRVIGSTATVTATCEGVAKPTTITMGAPVGVVTVEPQELYADGASQATVKVKLTFNGFPVDGHSVQWDIIKVYDATKEAPEDKTVFDIDRVPPGSVEGYGGLAAVTTVTNSAGEATATYTTGTEAGTITFGATDLSVYEDAAPSSNGSGGSLGGSSTQGVQNTNPSAASTTRPNPRHKSGRTTKPLVFNISMTPSGSGTGDVRGTKGQRIFLVELQATLPSNTTNPPAKVTFVLGRPNPKTAYIAPSQIDAERVGTTTSYKAIWYTTKNEGRWVIRLKQGSRSTPNQLTFKIDKRKQIVSVAEGWLGATAQELNEAVLNGGLCLCGGFTQLVYNQVGLTLPASQNDQYADITDYSFLDGSLLFFSRLPTPNWHEAHVAIKAGSQRINVNSATNPGPGVISRNAISEDYDPDFRPRAPQNLILLDSE